MMIRDKRLRARVTFYSIQDDSVKSTHPIRQYVVDARRFDRTPASTKEEERTALPEKIGVNAIYHRNWAAGSVVATGRVTRVSAPVTKQVSARPLEPLPQQVPRLGVAADVCAFQGAVDYIEMGVAVIVGRATQHIVDLHIVGSEYKIPFQSNQVVEIDRIQIELEVGAVIVEQVKVNRRSHSGDVGQTLTFINRAEPR